VSVNLTFKGNFEQKKRLFKVQVT